MTQTNLQLDPIESRLVTLAADAAVTRRRIWYSVLVPAALIFFLVGMFWRDAQPRLLLWLFVGYVLIGVVEKVSYGLAVLAYKRLVFKLVARVNELETQPAGRNA